MTESTIKIGTYAKPKTLLEVSGRHVNDDLFVVNQKVEANQHYVVKSKSVRSYWRRTEAEVMFEALRKFLHPTQEEKEHADKVVRRAKKRAQLSEAALGDHVDRGSTAN